MHSNRVRFASLAAIAALALVSRARAAENNLDIGVRAVIADGLASKEAQAQISKGHGRKFAIYPAVEVFSGHKLAHPVDDATREAMYQVLQEKLLAAGYHPITTKEKPDVLVTLQYGRGILANPFDVAHIEYDNSGGGRSLPPMAGFPGYRMWEPGREAKTQAAMYQKLFITVSAWDFNTMQGGKKPRRLWSSTMNVDDPDHRDFADIYKQMLAAGAPFFNREIQEEVSIPTAIREGRVEIGPTRVVDDAKSAAK